MSKCYKLNLYPVGSFYFGNEKKFHPGGEEKTNYLVTSGLFPQQTTLLGMLRYALAFRLLKTEEKIEDQDLIGDQSFSGLDTAWGIIDRLSAVYVENKEHLYVEAGLNCQEYKGHAVRFIPVRVNAATYMEGRELYRWAEYNPKSPFRHYLVPVGKIPSDGNLLAYDAVFQACSQLGNRKDRNGVAREEAFYKQTRYRLKPGFSFCFYLQVTQKLCPGEFRTFMGGDQSVFRITVEEVNGLPTSSSAGIKGRGIVKLLSDTYIVAVEEENILLSMVETVDFRFIKTRRKPGYNYADLDQKNPSESDEDRPVLSEKIRLIAKGSVFYCKDVKKFVEAIEAQKAYRRLGYNSYAVEEEGEGEEMADWMKFLYFYHRYQWEQFNKTNKL